MDEFLASVGRILESLPSTLTVPLLILAGLGVMWYAWMRSRDTAEKERQAAEEEKAGRFGVISSLHPKLDDLKDRVDEIYTKIEVIIDRGVRR